VKLIIILLWATCCFASCNQKKKADNNQTQTKDTVQQISKKSNSTDTTFIPVSLQDTSKEKTIVVVDIGQKATIYLKAKLLRQSAVEVLNDFNKEELSKIIQLLDSESLKNDTFFVDPYLSYFDYLVSEQLQKGNAKVFYKKIKSFVPTISHRKERYGTYAHRFFYLPDKRPFFSTMETSGILDEKTPFGLSDPKELEEVGRKLAGLREE